VSPPAIAVLILTSLAREIPRGNIYDRNGVLLATSDWKQLESRRAQYEALGVSLDAVCSPIESRDYPFGELTAHFLGDWRTGENFHATNASLVEHDSNTRLQGYQNYDELAPLVRYRHQPGNSDIERLLQIRAEEKKSQVGRRPACETLGERSQDGRHVGEK